MTKMDMFYEGDPVAQKKSTMLPQTASGKRRPKVEQR
jgi:hypothetical protein